MQSKSWCSPGQLVAVMLTGWINRQRRPGRPPKPQYIRDLVVRLAKENTSWGYTKLRDVMFTLGHKIG
jgi:hypothetical protein